jgi:hypothetical protein
MIATTTMSSMSVKPPAILFANLDILVSSVVPGLSPRAVQPACQGPGLEKSKGSAANFVTVPKIVTEDARAGQFPA